jgi:NADPH:quinone reductase-like Zn-dependent oxidoreductase
MSNPPRTMHAVLIRKFGGPEVVEFAEIPVPEPRAGEVLVKVEAASLNPVDYKIRGGKYPLVQADKLPFVLGRDFSGTVVHSDDAALPAGTLVHGLLDIEHGSLAQYTVARADTLARVPGAIDRIVAAAVPLAGLTAWQGLFDHGRLRAGQRVLIHAGAGGVGHLAVQFAKARGATVITTVSTDDVALARNLGADEVIDHTQERFESRLADIDLVFDLIGGDTQERSWAVLKKGGALVSTVQEPSQEKANAIDVRAMRYTAEPDADQLREIDALIESGKVRPLVTRTFAYGDAKEALRGLEQGHGSGKRVLDMAGVIAALPDPIYKPGD